MTFSIRKYPLSLLVGALAAAGSSFAAPNTPSADENALLIHVYRSPGLDWESPKKIAKSTISNAIAKFVFPIGHMTVDVRCGSQHSKSGMTQKIKTEDTRLIRKEKVGLGVLFHNFVGRYEDEAKVEQDLRIMLPQGRVGVMKILISAESCHRMQEFQANYVKTNMGRNYGMLSRTLKGEGGGCAAYGMAYPAIGGFLTDEMILAWSRYVKIPVDSVGAPFTQEKIGPLKLILGGEKQWATEDERGFPMFFYDPDKLYDWMKDAADGTLTGETANLLGKVTKIEVTPELMALDMRNKKNVAAMQKVNAFAIEVDRRDALPPETINYSLVQRNPVEPLSDPSLLATWWEKEIALHLKRK